MHPASSVLGYISVHGGTPAAEMPVVFGLFAACRVGDVAFPTSASLCWSACGTSTLSFHITCQASTREAARILLALGCKLQLPDVQLRVNFQG
jgi:hypothetical protein